MNIQEAIKLLKEIEWTCRCINGRRYQCLICGQYQQNGHLKDCRLGEALFLLETREALDLVDEQQAEIERLKASYDQLHIDYINRGREIERLKKALWTYGRHTNKCNKQLEVNNPSWLQVCNCGFEKALKEKD